jgi:hypothetical protein
VDLRYLRQEDGGPELRDYSFRRPGTRFVSCPSPECFATYPAGLVRALGEMRCGSCGERFAFRRRVGLVRLDAPPADVQPPPLPEVESPVAADSSKPLRRDDVHGSVSRSVRTSETELAEWQEAADAAGMSLNGYMRRLVNEGVALDKASAAHPAHLPASKATREDET